MWFDTKINYKALELAKFGKLSLSLSLSVQVKLLHYKNVVLEPTYHLIQAVIVTWSHLHVSSQV